MYQESLSKLGIKIQEKEDGMILESSGNLRGAELNSENDHRLFMAFCIAGMYIGELYCNRSRISQSVISKFC